MRYIVIREFDELARKIIRTYQSIPSFSLVNVCYQQGFCTLTCIDGNSRERASLGLMVNDRGGP